MANINALLRFIYASTIGLTVAKDVQDQDHWENAEQLILNDSLKRATLQYGRPYSDYLSNRMISGTYFRNVTGKKAKTCYTLPPDSH
jgi:hypothetical protein